jgi:sulfur carrier protein ThiS adenylyltransferase
MTFEEIKKILSTKCVGIAGAGGLGSNVAAALVRTGIHQLVIADFDVVSASNLNRQFYFRDQIGVKKVFALRDNLFKINDKAIIKTHDCRVSKDNIIKLFSDCQIIVEAFDRAEMKEMLIEELLDKLPDIPIISGVGLAGWGYSNDIRVRNYGKLFICGDMEREVAANMPPLAPRVTMVAAMQANVVLEILLKNEYNEYTPE